MIRADTLAKGMNVLGALVGRELTDVHYEIYASALSDLSDTEFAAAVATLAKSWTENRIPPPAKIIEVGKGRTSTQGRVEADAHAADIFRELMWAYDDCVDGQYSYNDAKVIRRFGARVLVALRAIGGGSKMDLARYDDEQRKWALKEFQDAMRGIADDRGAQAALATWVVDRAPTIARRDEDPKLIGASIGAALGDCKK